MQLTNKVESSIAHAPVAAGSADVTDSYVVDMQGFEGVRFTVSFGTLTSGAVTSIRAQQAAAKTSATALTSGADIAGSSVAVADTESNKLFVLDIYKPQKRYVQLVIKRATQNAVVNLALAEKYGIVKLPVTKHADVSSQKLLVSPADGTA